ESRYTIQWGDTLGTIADALDIPVNQIVNVNEIANRDLIIAGNTLHLSADLETVSIEDQATEEVQSYEIEEPVEETEEAAEEEVVEEQPAQEEAAEEEAAEHSIKTYADTTTGSALKSTRQNTRYVL